MQVLQELYVGQLYLWLIVFVRLGSAFMVMPTIGDPSISPRTRLLFALAVTVVVTPAVRDHIPPEPQHVLRLAVLIAGEVLVGVFLGTVGRLLLSTLEMAGALIAMQAGLSNAQVFNPAMASQGSLPGALLGWLGLLLIFITDQHHVLIMAVADSYTLFVPGAPIPINDMADMIGRLVARSFVVGTEMAGPFVVTGVLFALALGLLNKLAPQIQVFFLFMSTQVALGLFLFALTLSAMMLFWLGQFESTMIEFLNPS